MFYFPICLDENKLTGSIPTKIGLMMTAIWLSELFYLIYVSTYVRFYESFFFLTISKSFPKNVMLDFNELTGSVPSEIGLLTATTDIDFGELLFCVY